MTDYLFQITASVALLSVAVIATLCIMSSRDASERILDEVDDLRDQIKSTKSNTEKIIALTLADKTVKISLVFNDGAVATRTTLCPIMPAPGDSLLLIQPVGDDPELFVELKDGDFALTFQEKDIPETILVVNDPITAFRSRLLDGGWVISDPVVGGLEDVQSHADDLVAGQG